MIKRFENKGVWLDVDTEKRIVIDGSAYWLDYRSGLGRESEQFSDLISDVLPELTKQQILFLKKLCPNDEILKSCYNKKFNSLYNEYLKIWKW